MQAFLAAGVALASAFAWPGPVQAAPRALVAWSGECDDADALARELLERGVSPSSRAEPGPDSLSARVSVRREGGELAAELELTTGDEDYESRDVRAKQCSELRSAVALVLGVLARERAAAREPKRAPSVARAQAAETLGAPPPPSAPVAAQPPLVATVTLSPRAFTLRDARAEPRWRFGTAFSLGAGLLPKVALAPSLFLEREVTAALALRLSAVELVSLPYVEQGVTISVKRFTGQLALIVKEPSFPVFGALGAELGALSARGAGTPDARQQTVPWFALSAALGLRQGMLAGRLTVELGAGLAYSPFRYAFQNRDSSEVISRSAPLELRPSVGLGAHW